MCIVGFQIVRVTNDKREGRGTRKCNCRQQMVTRQQGYFIQQMMETKLRIRNIGCGVCMEIFFLIAMILHNRCDTCPSIDFVPMLRTLEVEIEKGMRDGSELVCVLFFGLA